MYTKYLKYLLRHKWYVMVECYRDGLILRGLLHDLSKFLPDEFVPYARYFYGNYPSIQEFHGDVRNLYLSSGCYKEKVDRDFDMAWLKHQKRNKHHWQWWVLREDSGNTKILDMEYVYIREMICDWVGAGKAQGFVSPKEDKFYETRKWYEKNKDKMLLSSFARTVVEDKLAVGKKK